MARKSKLKFNSFNKKKLVTNSLNILLAILMMGIGVCISEVWYSYNPTERHTTNIVNVEYRLKGDVNGDGRVNEADIEIIKSNTGKASPTYRDGDLNEDGVVDALDLSITLQWQGAGNPNVMLLKI